jgi:hypothetical protein
MPRSSGSFFPLLRQHSARAPRGPRDGERGAAGPPPAAGNQALDEGRGPPATALPAGHDAARHGAAGLVCPGHLVIFRAGDLDSRGEFRTLRVLMSRGPQAM